jgi:hypothetical protein
LRLQSTIVYCVKSRIRLAYGDCRIAGTRTAAQRQRTSGADLPALASRHHQIRLTPRYPKTCTPCVGCVPPPRLPLPVSGSEPARLSVHGPHTGSLTHRASQGPLDHGIPTQSRGDVASPLAHDELSGFARRCGPPWRPCRSWLETQTARITARTISRSRGRQARHLRI